VGYGWNEEEFATHGVALAEAPSLWLPPGQRESVLRALDQHVAALASWLDAGENEPTVE
jgi:hypothetical protein